MIFLSHNHKDKLIVEPIALGLADIFGQDKVFYDSWSIQPGDGIIDKMNEGLADPRFVFFFVSKNSLQSEMVKLEWQNALFKATEGQCKLIPVRMDDSALPAILTQNLYLDLFSNGLEATIAQIVNVAQGNNSFTPQYGGFSNLTYSAEFENDKKAEFRIRASHYLEPHADFMVISENGKNDLQISLKEVGVFTSAFQEGLRLEDGLQANGFFVGAVGGGISPGMHLTIVVEANGEATISFLRLLHKKRRDYWAMIPQKD